MVERFLISRALRQGRSFACAILLAAIGMAAAGSGASAGSAPQIENAEQSEFRRFVESLWPEAKARGVSRAVFDVAFEGVTLDSKIVALTKKQSEFVQPIWGYIASAVKEARLARGREVAAQWSTTLDGIERAYGVPRSVILGVWGMETNFGSFTGNIYVVGALATLAYTGYRSDFFRDELLTALQILQQGHIPAAEMRGSWAGAMGQTQFMPSSFMKHAVDGDGDRRRDIWSSVPDALASTANYLRQHGWKPGLPWGFEVELPEGFDFRHDRQNFSGWSSLGLRRMDGQPMPRSGEAMLFLPTGARGPAFLVTENYNVVKAYNSSDAYALGVAHLGDRIAGGLPIRGEWPMNAPTLDVKQRQEVQQRLASLGLYSGETDGKFGSKTRDAVRQFQLKRNLVPDGYADPAVLNALRAVR